MAGKIIADIIEAPAGRISLNVANVTVASINASGLYTSTGNLIISQANQIGTAAIVDGAVTTAKIVDGAVTNAKLTLAANASNIKTALNASGDAPIYACRAWVNFNGQSTVSIRASGNVSSITDNGGGNYTVNFTNALVDTNYCVTAWARSDAVSASKDAYGWISAQSNYTKTTSAMQFNQGVQQSGITYQNADSPEIGVAIFR
jgi:hypothetical protein